MAMGDGIPVSLPNRSFDDVFDYLEKVRDRKSKQPLLEAQTQEAQANAAKSNMYANLINMALGGAPSADNSQGQGMANPAMQNTSTGMQGANPSSPTGVNPATGVDTSSQQQRAKEMAQALGIIKETPAEQAARERQSAYGNKLGEVDADVLKDWNKSITADYAIQPVLENIQEITSKPKIQAIYKNPEYMNYDVAFAKRFNKDPEVQQDLTSLGTNIKSIFSTMGSEFKGAFREFEMNLFNAAAPTEGDSLNQLVAKTNTLMHLRTLAMKRYSLADQIVRAGGGKISPASALEMANKQVSTKEVREQIKQEYKQLEDLKKQKKETPKDMAPVAENTGNPSAENQEPLMVLYKDGQEYRMPAKIGMKALQSKEGFTSAK